MNQALMTTSQTSLTCEGRVILKDASGVEVIYPAGAILRLDANQPLSLEPLAQGEGIGASAPSSALKGAEG